MTISPLAGHPPPETMLRAVGKLVTAYYAEIPAPSVPAQRVAFGTSGHRGSSFEKTFNESHVLAISEAICRYRREQGIGGPLFLCFDTHALSGPALTYRGRATTAHRGAIPLREPRADRPPAPAPHDIPSLQRRQTPG